MSTRFSVGLTAALAMLLVFPGGGAADPHDRGRNISINTHGNGPITNCGQLEVRFDHLRVAYQQEERTFSRTAVSQLDVPAPEHGGVQVHGWDRDEYSVTACKAAGAGSRAEAEQIAKGISLKVQEGRVAVNGPASEDWVVYLILRVPSQANLNLEARNGPIGLSKVSGKVRVNTVNGPLSIDDCAGEINAETRNGPLSLSGSSGNIRLRAQNGPLSVELTGRRWEGGELEAETHNGPLSLHVPESYESSVRVDASEHSPVRCRAAQCAQALRTWAHPSRIEFGKGAPVVRLSTVNGPVSIE